MMVIRSPLRYPGGKSKALKKILPLIPKFNSFIEPFVGGGSIFIALKQKFPDCLFWINDLNKDVYLFWKFAQSDLEILVDAIWTIKKENADGRKLFESYKENWNELNDFDRAVRFFVLNRITFSGTIDSGGYSRQSFERRFTDSSIERLSKLNYVMDAVKITNLDYEDIIHADADSVFIFLDPPYYSTTNSRLYGKKGNLHKTFDHLRFSENMKRCKHKWLITYDDCPKVRELFDFANIVPWSMQYGMNNYKQDSAGIGQELFITNYPIGEREEDYQLNISI